jgi:uncharacterized membrane protein
MVKNLLCVISTVYAGSSSGILIGNKYFRGDRMFFIMVFFLALGLAAAFAGGFDDIFARRKEIMRNRKKWKK